MNDFENQGHFVFITIPAADKQDGMDLWQKLMDGWADESLCKFLGSVVTVI
ncbi:hypothetical protein HAP94_05130 [Acidithiobacillus ferrivorans]|nr:hypothetical protein [Acidithiobacillus ferrivorans]